MPEPVPVAEALVTATVDIRAAACKLKPAANNVANKNRVALEPAENESNPIDELMLNDGLDSCKENVIRQPAPSFTSNREWSKGLRGWGVQTDTTAIRPRSNIRPQPASHYHHKMSDRRT